MRVAVQVTQAGTRVDEADPGARVRRVVSRPVVVDAEQEPLPADSPLLELPNTVLTPHAAWYSEESQVELKRRTAQNVADVLAGRKPRNIVNSEVLA